MTLLDLLRSPWAIEPFKLTELQAIYATHLRGDKIDIAAIEARLGRPLANAETVYEVLDGGVALLTLEGVLAPKANLFMQISGGVSTRMAERAVLDAMADPAVKSMVLAMDSPGGNVHGTPELAAAVRRFGAEKPIAALNRGSMTSAAYWVGSAANAVYVTGPTTTIGSIGVIATHSYTPNADGTQVTKITAGRYKAMASEHEPLSDDGKQAMQGMVDAAYGLFVDAVAEQRGVSAAQVLEHMADGRVFNGQQALSNGLADGVFAYDQLIEAMATNPEQFAARKRARIVSAPTSKGAGAAPKDQPVKKGSSMSDDNTLTRASLEKDHAALFAELRGEFMAMGATSERQRIQGVLDQAIPGQEALVNGFAFDGKTTPGEAAIAVNQAHRADLGKQADQFAKDAPAAAAASAVNTAQATKTKTQMAAEATAYAAEHRMSIAAAFQHLGYSL